MLAVLSVLLVWDRETQHPAGFIPQTARTVSIRKAMMKREMKLGENRACADLKNPFQKHIK